MKLWPCCLVGGLLAVACGPGSGPSGGGTGGTGGGAGTAAAFIVSYCNTIVPCCVKAGLPGRGQGCQALFGALEDPSTYNPAAGEMCLQAVQQLAMQPDFCTDMPAIDDVCDGVFMSAAQASGSGAPGALCMTDSDCAAPTGGGSTCWQQTMFVDGGTQSTATCIELTAGKSGQGPCLETLGTNESISSWSGGTPPPDQAYLCKLADGVYCNSSTRMCTPLGTTGQPCEEDQDCVTGDYCSYPGTGGASTCATRIADGASCMSSSSISTGPCQTTSYCDSSSQTCKPQLAYGAACTLDQQCPNRTCTNGLCGGSGDSGLTALCGQ
jgi:hypothetical protein